MQALSGRPAAAAAASAPRRPRCGPMRPPPRRAPLRVAALSAGASDHTVRVRGDPARVSYYTADLARWPDWSPVTKAAVKLGNAGDVIAKGTKFELQQELWGVLSYTMIVQVLEFEPGRKLVLSGLSDHHTQLDQWIFMADNKDPNMTVVRYVSDSQLRQWKSALMPVMSKLLSRVSSDSVSALQALLNGPKSPLLTSAFQQRYTQFARASVDARKGRKSTAASGAAASGGSGGRNGSGASGWSFDSIFGGSKRRSGAEAASGAAAAAATTSPPADPAGHYLALGLTARLAAGGPPPSDDEVRTAYRRLVMELHPDKQSGKSAAAQRRAADDFRRVLRAYEVLRDAETRRLYDSGALVEQSVEL